MILDHTVNVDSKIKTKGILDSINLLKMNFYFDNLLALKITSNSV